MNVFDLSASLRLDTGEYDSGLANAESKGSSFVSRFGGVMKKGAIAGAALAGVGAAVGGAFVKAAKSTSEYGDKVDKMSQKIGISAEGYQKWDYVMKRAGGNVDSLKMGMKTLSQQAEKQSDAFDELGISQKEVASMNKEELFSRTVKELAGMEDSTKRTALATELLGRAGADMGPLLNQGAGAIEDQMEIAEKYGMVMSDETVKASAAWEDSITTMQMTATGLKNRLMGEFLPSLTLVTDGLGKLFAGDMSGVEDIQKGIDQFASKLQTVLPKVFKIGGDILGNLAKSLIDNLPKLMDIGIKVVGQIGQFILDNLDTIINTAVQLMVKLAEGIVKAIPIVVRNLPKIIKAIVSGFLSLGKQLLPIGKSLMSSVASGIRSMAGKVGSAALRIAKSIPQKIKSGVGNLAAVAREFITKLANGIKEKASDVASKALELAKKIPKKIKEGIGNLWDIGANAIEGLKKGIADKWDALVNWFGDKVGSLKKKGEEKLEVNSPSKVFMRLGSAIPEGFALGIENNLDYVDDAMDDMYDMTTANVAGGTFVPAMQAIMTEGMASVMGDWAPDLADAMAEALQNVTVKMGRRELGRLTREAVNGTI